MAITTKAEKNTDITLEMSDQPKKKAKAQKQEAGSKAVTWADVNGLKKQYLQLSVDVQTGKETDISKLRKMRREIARALTQLNLKQQ